MIRELDTTTEIKRLRWQCRRGMREMDMLLERWLDRYYSEASRQTKADFAALLLTEDDLLWDWLMGKGAPLEPERAELIHAIRSSFSPGQTVQTSAMPE
jgi:antitoxin CptB